MKNGPPDHAFCIFHTENRKMALSGCPSAVFEPSIPNSWASGTLIISISLSLLFWFYRKENAFIIIMNASVALDAVARFFACCLILLVLDQTTVNSCVRLVYTDHDIPYAYSVWMMSPDGQVARSLSGEWETQPAFRPEPLFGSLIFVRASITN